MMDYGYSEEELQSEALKYKTRFEFIKCSREMFTDASRQGLLNKICSHMEKPQADSVRGRNPVGFNVPRIRKLLAEAKQ